MTIRHLTLALCTVLLAACDTEPTSLAGDSEPQLALAAHTLLNQELARVRAGTARFHDVAVAVAEGYTPVSDCVAVPGLGGMGIHFVNFGLVADAAYSPASPEALLYQPQEDGSLKLVGVEYVVVQAAWHAAGNVGRPTFHGHPFEAAPAMGPNPATYTLHAWVWTPNPEGVFVPFNPAVRCPSGTGHQH